MFLGKILQHRLRNLETVDNFKNMTNTRDYSTSLPIRLGMDLDGVIYNFVDEFRIHVAGLRGVDPDSLPVVNKWEFYLDWGMTLEEYMATLAEAAVQGHVFKNGLAYEGAAEALRKVRDMNFHIVAITARKLSDAPNDHQIVCDNTAAWLKANDIVYDELIVDNTKTRHNLNILVDDSIGNVEEFIRAGTKAYIFDRPWNCGVPYSRIMDWDDFVVQMQEVRDMIDSAFLNDLQAATA